LLSCCLPVLLQSPIYSSPARSSHRCLCGQ
jgi:hypothetical protein